MSNQKGIINTYQYDRPIYILGLVFQVPATPESNYLTLTLKGLGFDTFQTNLLTIPSTVLHGKIDMCS